MLPLRFFLKYSREKPGLPLFGEDSPSTKGKRTPLIKPLFLAPLKDFNPRLAKNLHLPYFY